MPGRFLFVLVFASTACLRAVGADEVLLTDLAQLAGDVSWRAVPYETKDGIKGTMLYAPWSLKPRTRIEIPLPVRGRHRIFLGLCATRVQLDAAPFKALVRLARDPAPVMMDSIAPSSDAGWWMQLAENDWKAADLDGDTLVVENPRGCRVGIAWVRLVPEEAKPEARREYGMIATNDAYAPADDMDELLAPIMRLKDSPVSEIHYCVANGAYSFAVPSRVAVSSETSPGALYENKYAEDCAATYAWIRRTHPNVLDELADFTHAQGMRFMVSFRTGCTADHMRISERPGVTREDKAGFGICRPERMCRLWDGTVVPRFSYADAGVQEWFLKLYAEMLSEKVDGISLIWIRALPAMLFESVFRERFRAAYGEELTREDDPRVLTLRTEIMTEFHRRVRALAGKRKFTVFVPPDEKTCLEFGLDVRRLAREGVVDEFVVGNTKQTARHDESFEYIDFAFFSKVWAETKVPFKAYFWGHRPEWDRSIQGGASGVAFWDAGMKDWATWESLRLLGDDGTRAREHETAHPPASRVHPLKTLDGMDASVFPWHVAY